MGKKTRLILAVFAAAALLFGTLGTVYGAKLAGTGAMKQDAAGTQWGPFAAHQYGMVHVGAKGGPFGGFVPAYPGTVRLQQPDGSVFSARQWGDEWRHGWEAKGRRIIKDAATGYWYYARVNEKGELVSTGVRADEEPPAELEEYAGPAPLRERKPGR